MKERYKEILDEVMDEINSSLEDSRGMVIHQRRLIFCLSVGVTTLIEIYLDKLNVLKQGAKIDHLWLKKSKENAKKFIVNQIVVPIENIKDLDKFLETANIIEKERNTLAYGKNVSETILKNKIDLFLKLKEETENV
ncbi:MAG: hypothetical protein AABW67_06000 [Nanoarchaeota archaeon]